MKIPDSRSQFYTTVLRDEAQSGAWLSIGVSGPTRSVLLSMESSLSWEGGAGSDRGQEAERSACESSPFIWLGANEMLLCAGEKKKKVTASFQNRESCEERLPAPTQVYVEEAVRVDGGLVRRGRVIRVVDVGVFVGSVWRGRLLEVESAPLAVVREVQGSEAGTKHVRAVVKSWDTPPEVKVMH